MRHVTVAFVLLGAALAAAHVAGQTSGDRASKPSMTVYKSPTCGCCSKWIEHMKANGFIVTAVDVDDIEVPMKTYGVPASLGSCHTAIVNGYVVEGHVPADVVSRMLREKPPIAGISAPGMPAGSPGMEVGDYKQPYSIVSFDKAGRTAVYDRR
jgi:hypothetical protein